MKKFLLSLIALVAMSVSVMADPVVKLYITSNGQEIEVIDRKTTASQIEGFKFVVTGIDVTNLYISMCRVRDYAYNTLVDKFLYDPMDKGTYSYTFEEPILLEMDTDTEFITFYGEFMDEGGSGGTFDFHADVFAAEAPTAVDVTFDIEGFSYYRFQMNDSTWYLRWQGKEQSSTPHTLALYRTTNLDSKFGHFTTADFDLTESYFNGDWVGDYVTEIDVTLTETEYGFTMSGYVVAGNGVTYNLAGEYAAPKATPSVTSFTTLSELDGLTITLSGVEVQFAGQDGAIYLTDESLDVLYGEGHNYTFSNNVLTIESFVYDAEEMDPLPEEGKDMLIYTGNVFAGYRDLLLCTIHFGTSPSALENTAAEVKAVKTIENGQIVIIREGKRYNAVGAEL